MHCFLWMRAAGHIHGFTTPSRFEIAAGFRRRSAPAGGIAFVRIRWLGGGSAAELRGVSANDCRCAWYRETGKSVSDSAGGARRVNGAFGRGAIAEGRDPDRFFADE